MKAPEHLLALVEEGVIDEVLRPLLSGKEAAVYIVRSGQELCCAKVYKDTQQRSFKHSAEYQEGRHVRNSREARALKKRSKYGREQAQMHWHQAELNALMMLQGESLCVPQALGCFDGVLLMELITDEHGDPAPRLADVTMSQSQARAAFALVIGAVQHMLQHGLVHGDLSEFNVLQGVNGPVIIDFPQVINAAANPHAERILTRDVNNMRRYFSRFAPELRATHYASELWRHYRRGTLSEAVLTGEKPTTTEELDDVLDELQAMLADDSSRPPAPPRRKRASRR